MTRHIEDGKGRSPHPVTDFGSQANVCRQITVEGQRVFGCGPSMKREFCVIPRARFKCGSSSMSQSRVMISRSLCDSSTIICSTARRANASNVSLLCSKADRMDGEWTSSRNRITVAASVRCVGGKFCHSNFFDALIAASNKRSVFMRRKPTRSAGVPGVPPRAFSGGVESGIPNCV